MNWKKALEETGKHLQNIGVAIIVFAILQPILRRNLVDSDNNIQTNRNYSFIYDYALEAYKDRIETLKRLDEKAQRYISILLIFISLQSIIFKFLLNNDTNSSIVTEITIIDAVIVIFMSITTLYSLIVIHYLIRVLKVKPRYTFPLNEKVIDFANKYGEDTFKISFVTKLQYGLKTLQDNINTKGKFLGKAYKVLHIIFIVFSLQVFFIMIKFGYILIFNN